MSYAVGQLTYSVFPPVADPGMLGDNSVQRIESFPAAETIQPGRGLLMTSSGTVEQAQGTRSDTTTVLDLFGFSILRTSREGLGQENDSTTLGGAAYNAGDMVPVLRRGCLYAEWKGTTIPAGGPTYTQLNMYQSSTTATDRGKVTDAAAASTSGSEVGPIGGRVRVKPVLPALSNTGNIILLDISFPGSAA